jgi:hypothetical protein
VGQRPGFRDYLRAGWRYGGGAGAIALAVFWIFRGLDRGTSLLAMLVAVLVGVALIIAFYPIWRRTRGARWQSDLSLEGDRLPADAALLHPEEPSSNMRPVSDR